MRWLLAVIVLTTCLLASGCRLPTTPLELTQSELEKQRIAVRELNVLPVFVRSGAAGFPISSRNAVMSVHGLDHACSIVAVCGNPMILGHTPWQGKPELVPPEIDWAVVYSKRERFRPNVIDGNVRLRAGDVVFIGGFPVDPITQNLDPVAHALRKPEIIAGRIVSPEFTEKGPGLVTVEVPYRDYHGVSGGPVAVVDDSGIVRVWGLPVRLAWEWDLRGLRFVIRVARLPQSDLDGLQYRDFAIERK